MTDDQPLPLPQQLLEGNLYCLSLLGSAARLAAIGGLAGFELRLDHVAILASLADFGPSPQRTLGRRLRKDPSDVVGTLDGLQADGSVRRDPDPDDGRRNLVTITPQGRTRLRLAQKALGAVEDEFLLALSPADRQRLQQLLRAALAGIDGRA